MMLWRKITAGVFIFMLCALAAELGGALFFAFEHGSLVYVNDGPANSKEGANASEIRSPFVQRMHPYFGFTASYSAYTVTKDGVRWSQTNSLGFPQLDSIPDLPFSPKANEFVVAVFGGSVAGNVSNAPQGGMRIREAIQNLDVLKSKKVVVVNMAQGSGKQPQQLIELAYLMSLGQKIDLVLNVDGFNDFALAYINHANGIHPIFPSNQITVPLAHQIGQPNERSLEYLKFAYEMSSTRAAVAHRSDALARSRTGLSFATNKIALAYQEGRLNRFKREYDTVFHPFGHAGRWREISYAVGIDSRLNLPDEAAMEVIFDLWIRASWQMKALAVANGAKFVHIVQPYIYDSKPYLAGDELKIVDVLPANHVYRTGAAMGYRLLREKIGLLNSQGIVSAIGLFENTKTAMYADPFHYNKEGETVFARFIAAAVERELAGKAEAPLSTGSPLPSSKPCYSWRVSSVTLDDVQPFGGNAYAATVPGLSHLRDREESPERSPAILCEDGDLLGPAHSAIETIQKSGRGAFSHYGAGAVFSTSDNSDPRFNGRAYWIAVPPDRP